MPLNWKMDKENVVNLLNGVLHSGKINGTLKICVQVVQLEKNPEWGNPDPER